MSLSETLISWPLVLTRMVTDYVVPDEVVAYVFDTKREEIYRVNNDFGFASIQQQIPEWKSTLCHETNSILDSNRAMKLELDGFLYLFSRSTEQCYRWDLKLKKWFDLPPRPGVDNRESIVGRVLSGPHGLIYLISEEPSYAWPQPASISVLTFDTFSFEWRILAQQIRGIIVHAAIVSGSRLLVFDLGVQGVDVILNEQIHYVKIPLKVERIHELWTLSDEKCCISTKGALWEYSIFSKEFVQISDLLGRDNRDGCPMWDYPFLSVDWGVMFQFPEYDRNKDFVLHLYDSHGTAVSRTIRQIKQPLSSCFFGSMN